MFEPMLEAAVLSDFLQHGYVVLEDALTPAELAMLQAQASCVTQRLAAAGRDLCDEQCVAEVLEHVPEGHAARTAPDEYLRLRESELPSTDPALMRALLVRKLAAAASAALALGAESPTPCLFNEHFVLKPARRGGAFAWHTDGAHQLEALLALGDPAAAPEYVSIWCALDDITEANGIAAAAPTHSPGPGPQP